MSFEDVTVFGEYEKGSVIEKRSRNREYL